MTPNALMELAEGHPDETGPFLCECCDATHPGPRDPALAEGWIFTWDGFLCPACANRANEEDACTLH